MLKMFKALKELKREGGMSLCKPCLERKVFERTNDHNAFEKSIESGYYKPAKEGKECYICSCRADYFITLKDCMKSITKVSKS